MTLPLPQAFTQGLHRSLVLFSPSTSPSQAPQFIPLRTQVSPNSLPTDTPIFGHWETQDAGVKTEPAPPDLHPSPQSSLSITLMPGWPDGTSQQVL